MRALSQRTSGTGMSTGTVVRCCNWNTSKPNRKILVSESLRGYSSSGRLNSSGTPGYPPWGVTRGPPGPVPRVPPKCRDCAESCNFMQGGPGGSLGVGGPLGAGISHTIILHTPFSGFQFYHLKLRFIISIPVKSSPFRLDFPK